MPKSNYILEHFLAEHIETALRAGVPLLDVIETFERVLDALTLKPRDAAVAPRITHQETTP